MRTDSLWGSLRFKGLKSKVTAGRARSEATPASAATATVRPGRLAPFAPPRQGPIGRRRRRNMAISAGRRVRLTRPGDRHAGGGDDAELGEAPVVRGSEREKAEAGAQRAQRQRSGDACDRRPQRRRLALAAAERLLKAQHHVNAEIDAEANEQDRKGHRDQIEAADGQGRETRGEYQTDRQGKQRGHAQPGRPQAPDQQRRDREGAQAAGKQRTRAGARQLLGVEHRAAGEAETQTVVGSDAQGGGFDPQGGDRVGRRRHRAVVEPRLGLDHGRGRRRVIAAAQSPAPGQLGGLPGPLRLDHLRHGTQHAIQLGGGLALPLMLERQFEEASEPAQARILGQRGEQRLRLRQAVGQRLELAKRQIQQAVLRKEGLAGRIAHRGEVVARAQPVGQGTRRPVHTLGRVAFDHRHDGIAELRKGLLECRQVATKRHIRRDHFRGAGIDPQMLQGDRQRRGRDEHERDHHRQRPSGEPIREPGQRSREVDHAMAQTDVRTCDRGQNVITCGCRRTLGGFGAR